MKRLALIIAVVAGWHLGCGSKSLSPTSGPADATAPVLQVGAGADCAIGGGYGVALDAGLPPAGAGVPSNRCGALPADVSTFPWVVTLPSSGPGAGGSATGAGASVGAGGATGAGGGGVSGSEAEISDAGVGGTGGATSGCLLTPTADNSLNVTCSGAAWLRPTGGAADNGPTITWDDGAQLQWPSYGPVSPIAAPIAPGAPAQRVWAEMQSHENSVKGPFATIGSALTFDETTTIQTMTLRDTQGGNIRFIAQQGDNLPDPTPDQLNALFGVTADAVPTCSLEDQGVGYAVRATVDDHLLETTPPQKIPYGRTTRVTAPNGTFDVFWYTRAQEILEGSCDNAVHQVPMVGFLASRVASP
jgi:hypothetical protein